MLKFALIAFLVTACADDMKPLTADLVDCNFQVKGFSEKCSPTCADTSYVGPRGVSCDVARFANDPVTYRCSQSQWRIGEDGSERMGCCVASGDRDFPIPSGEIRFYECDRSYWPER